MNRLSPRAARLSVAALSLCLLGACEDLPTGTEAFQLEADGQLWTAVMPPADLPSAETWLAFSVPTAEALEATEAVGLLLSDADRARAKGDLEGADELLDRAARRAVGVMEVSPGAAVFSAGVASLQAWQRSVENGLDLSRVPALAQAVEEVKREREALEKALREGDDPAAALHLTRAADRIRAWAPRGVALQVLQRVEAHLASAGRAGGEGERAAHLVKGARQELLEGDPLRAVQRALYALQLAGGSELHEIPREDRARCGEYAC